MMRSTSALKPGGGGAAGAGIGAGGEADFAEDRDFGRKRRTHVQNELAFLESAVLSEGGIARRNLWRGPADVEAAKLTSAKPLILRAG